MKEVKFRWVDRYLIHLTLSEKCHVELWFDADPDRHTGALMVLVIHDMMTFVCGAVAGTQGLKATASELTQALNGIKI